MTQHYRFSAPGRTEIGGNHTDHQHGCVLAAAVDLHTTADVTLNGTNIIRARSEGFSDFQIDLGDLSVHPEERNTSAALVRGIAAAFAQRGASLTGFDMSVRSDVLPGSGLSSSAAFEVLVSTICNTLFCENRLTPVEIAKISQYAENVYFGKPCGLMDQMACAAGGLVFMDFQNETPVVTEIDFDFLKEGYALCIIDSGGNHADLTDEYAAITRELRDLCAFFGKDYLRQIPQSVFMETLPRLRGQVPDRAILRAIHVYRENTRVLAQVQALQQSNIADFLALVKESGQSSWMYLQNIAPAGAIDALPVAFALALCDTLLGDKGAWRVHGGGFAGTVQAYVPLQLLDNFTEQIRANLGDDSCRVLQLCPTGSGAISPDSLLG